jgi:hypothetical protein
MQTSNGKAFEYACAQALHSRLSVEQPVVVVHSAPFVTAQDFFLAAAPPLQDKLKKAADAAARVICRLEPQLAYPEHNTPLFLSLQSDAKGKGGDVRDVLCVRKQNGWEIGLSCKHNHHAVKHSRLSAIIDFGAEWFEIPCSPNYFNAVAPFFEELRLLRDTTSGNIPWSAVEQKNARFYIPVLRAFMNELHWLDQVNPQKIPEQLIRYLIGKNDFYKVITDDARKTTRIEAINIAGTLNRPSGGRHAIAGASRLRLPTRFYNVDFKRDSSTTIEIVCDEGWAISMRIHSASAHVEPSLKFDVNLISVPHSIYTQLEPW